MKLPNKVIICEVGLRDGLQNLDRILSTEEKLAMIKELETIGFRAIEVGSFVHPKSVPQMANTDDVFLKLKQKDYVEYRALVPNAKGVERAIKSGCGKVKLNVSASEAHNLANLGMIPRKSLEGFQSAVSLAIENDVKVSGSISCPFGSPWDKKIRYGSLKEIIDSYKHLGVKEISLSDAAGVANPKQVYDLCSRLKSDYPQIDWWLHLHNTRGNGLANLLAGLQAGINRFDSSIAGLGGCPFIPGATGNISSEDTINMLEEMGIETGINLDSLIELGNALRKMLNVKGNSFVLDAGKSSSILEYKY